MKSRDRGNQSDSNMKQFEAISSLFEAEDIDLIEKIEAFGKYVSRQSIAKFLTKYELFKRMLHQNGSIVECGVLHGAGLLTWAKLSSIFEPANHTRKIIGFDTFEGFPELDAKDMDTGSSVHLEKKGLTGSSYGNVLKAIRVYDINRPVSHIPKVEVIEGDICETAEDYVKNNPHLVVSLLYLDLDIYLPTKKALEIFVPRMPRGSIICFDELNAKIFPGETAAVDEVLGLGNLNIQRFPFDSYVSYAVVE